MAEKTDFLTKFTQITNKSIEESKQLLSLSKKQVLILNKNKQNIEEAKIYIKGIIGLEEINELPGVYIIHKDKAVLTSSSFFKEGYFYIQNLSSLLPVLALDVNPEDTVLDMCAAPGGKTFNICNQALNKAQVTVNEASKIRANDLKKIIESYELNISAFFTSPAQSLQHILEKRFTKILVDAPCSGEGLLNIDDAKTLKYWNQKKVKQLRNLQKKIVTSAYKLLAPGGVLVYSTCTYSPEENEEIINYLLKTTNDLTVEKIELPFNKPNFIKPVKVWNSKSFNEQVQNCIRVLPTEIFEGFFVSKLLKAKQ